MTHPGRSAGAVAQNPPVVRSTLLSATFVQWAVIALIAWLPLQTPIAIGLFQYANLSAEATRGVLLAKDVVTAALILALAAVYLRRVHIHWFDWLAAGYVIVLAGYVAIPVILGTELPPIAIVASAREFLVPVELYALGRLAVAAGISVNRTVRAFLIVAAAAASFTLLLYLFVPVTFWSSVLDLVSFERVVQGISTARTLWDISLLGQYGVGESGSFARAVGPFTHPVGTAQYFVVPLILAGTGLMAARRVSPVVLAATLALIALFVAAVITPISRGAWLAAVAGVVLAGLLYRRILPTAVAVALVAVFIVLVPPFSYSVTSALSGTDSSVVGHSQAIEKGIDTAVDNPLGLGLGQADQFGAALGGEGVSAAVGESLYLALYVSVGPLGLGLFVAWLVGILLVLIPSLRPGRDSWMEIAIAASLTGLMVSGLTSSPLLRFTTGATFWLLLGLLVPNVASANVGELGRGAWARLYTRRHG